MNPSYYRLLSGDDRRGTYLALPATAGPWSRALQHGGPPSALAVTLADRVVRAESGREDLVPLRLAVDFVGPAPVGEFEMHVALRRVARSAALAEVTLSAGERECLLSRVWFVRTSDTSAVCAAPVPAPPVPQAVAAPAQWDFGYGASLDWRYTSGAANGPGPAAVWVCPRAELLEATGGTDDPAGQLPGLARVALVADSASGISAELDWSRWSFVNVDLDLHLARPFVGEWVHVDAVTQLGPAGSALARSTISDTAGRAGAGLQTLVLAPNG